MALNDRQRALYRRLVAARIWQFPGTMAQQEALLEDIFGEFTEAARDANIQSDPVARFTFKRNRTAAQATTGTRMAEADGVFAMTAQGVAAGFDFGRKAGGTDDTSILRLIDRPEHIFGFVVVGGVRAPYQPGGLFVPWGGNISHQTDDAHWVAPFNNSQRVFPRLILDLHPQEIHVYGGGVALMSASEVNASITLLWDGAKGFKLTLADADRRRGHDRRAWERVALGRDPGGRTEYQRRLRDQDGQHHLPGGRDGWRREDRA